jgi:hypothetical protein
MKKARIAFYVGAVSLFVLCFTAKTQNADQQKLIEIEKAFSAQPTPGPDAAAVAKQNLYEGNLNQLTPLGRVGMLPKARVVELSSQPDPNDPDVKATQTVSGFHVDVYGDTALVAYKMSETDTGHKDAALNTTDHFGCLDTFVKRNNQWLLVGNACSPSSPLPSSEWAAVKKAMAEQPKDVQQAYH